MKNGGTFSVSNDLDSGWIEFVETHPHSHLFHHPVWLNFLAKCYGFMPFVALVKNERNEILAGLPFMDVSTGGGRRWVSLPFSDFCPPLYTTPESLRYLEEEFIAEANRQNVDELELRWHYAAPDLFPSCEHVLTTTRLYPDSSRVLEKIKGSDFRKVKLGPKRGIEIEKATSLEAMKSYYRLHVQTRRRLGMPTQPWRFFQLLSEEIIQKGLGFISLARLGDEYLAGIVLLTWKNTLTYKFSATSQRGRSLYASYPVTWDAIAWGCENNYTTFDWGRSDLDDDGLRRFKSHWASEEKELIYSRNKETKATFLTKMMPFAKTIISNSPAWVSRLSGELLYRYFG